MDSIIQRILSLIDSCELNDKEILKELDVSNSSTLITDWRHQRSKSPKIKHIIKLSEFFNVSTDFILTGKTHSSELLDTEQELLQKYRTLPDSGKEKIKGYIDGYIAALNDKK